MNSTLPILRRTRAPVRPIPPLLLPGDHSCLHQDSLGSSRWQQASNPHLLARSVPGVRGRLVFPGLAFRYILGPFKLLCRHELFTKWSRSRSHQSHLTDQRKWSRVWHIRHHTQNVQSAGDFPELTQESSHLPSASTWPWQGDPSGPLAWFPDSTFWRWVFWMKQLSFPLSSLLCAEGSRRNCSVSVDAGKISWPSWGHLLFYFSQHITILWNQSCKTPMYKMYLPQKRFAS